RVRAAGEVEGQDQMLLSSRHFEISNGGEDLPPCALRRDPRDRWDEEILRLEALGPDDRLFDLAGLSAGELRLRAEQETAHPGFPFAAPLRDPVQVVTRHVDRPGAVR